MAVPIAVAVGYAVFSNSAAWRGDWWWGFNSLGQAMPIVLLATAFVVGWDAGSDASGIRTQVARAPEAGWKVALSLAAVPVGTAMTLYLVGTAVVAGLTWEADGIIDPRAALVLATHLLMILTAAAIGLVAGRVAAAPYSGAGAAACIGLLLVWAPAGKHELFGMAGASSPVVGATPSVRFYAVSIASLATITVVSTWYSRLGLVRSRASAGAAVLLAFVFAAASLGGTSTQFVASGVPATRCRGHSPEVCVYPGYDGLLDPAGRRLEAFLESAVASGVPRGTFASSFQQFGGVRPDVGTGVLEIPPSALHGGVFDVQALAGSISTPLWCDAMFGTEPPLVLLEHRQAVYDWVVWLAGALPDLEYFDRHPTMAGATASGRAVEIQRHLEALRSCRTE